MYDEEFNCEPYKKIGIKTLKPFKIDKDITKALKKMSKEKLPENLIIHTIRWILVWVIRLGIIGFALIFLFIGGFFAYKKYNSWNDELVILVAIKCGPNIVDPSKFNQEKIISFRGTRKNKET